MELADSADRIARAAFRKPGLRVDTKADSSPVTEADQAIEATVRTQALERHAELGVLGEKEGACGPSETRLIIDPIERHAELRA